MNSQDHDKPENQLHILTEGDVENLLLQIDSLYWVILNLSKKRAVKINFDPHLLSKEINT